MGDDIAESMGMLIGYLMVFGWIPYAMWVSTGAICTTVESIFTKKDRKKPQNLPTPTPKKPKPQRANIKVYSVEEAMFVLHVNKDTIKEYIADGHISTFNRDGEVVLLKRDVDHLIPKKKNKPKNSSYPVVSSYKDEHRISNPVEFST
tara:strand:- start:3725 stop:4168 length:444 start_codon:yes stop_codon:yes gene_type:complete